MSLNTIKLNHNNKGLSILKICFILLCFCLFSCTPLKDLKYLQTEADELTDKLTVQDYIYKINKGDNLYIDITTSNTAFRSYISSQRSEARTSSVNPEGLYLISYQVDRDGYIHIPFIEPIYVFNKTIEEVQANIKEALAVYVTDISVSVKLVNFNITILGEVNRPGQYFAPKASMNLFEAIGMAGDLTIYGNRKNVKLLRMTENGNYKMYKLDITEAGVITSDVFTLKPNDIIYIEPLRTKSFGLGTLTVSTVLSTITTVLVVLNFLL